LFSSLADEESGGGIFLAIVFPGAALPHVPQTYRFPTIGFYQTPFRPDSSPDTGSGSRRGADWGNPPKNGMLCPPSGQRAEMRRDAPGIVTSGTNR